MPSAKRETSTHWVHGLVMGAGLLIIFTLGSWVGDAQSSAIAAPPAVMFVLQPGLPGTTTVETLEVDGLAREAIVYVPASLPAGAAAPVILILHPGTWNAAAQAQAFGVNEEAERLGFIAVYPNGTELPQNTGTNRRNFNGGAPNTATGIDDVRFIIQLLDALDAKYPIDASRIFSMGFSNGATMSYRLACEFSDRFAAIAVIAGFVLIPACEPTRPVSVLHIHGTNDPLAPYAGGQTPLGAVVPAVSEVVDVWQTHNGCASGPAIQMFTPVVEQQTYAPCRAGAEVRLYTVQGGFHCWPGREVVAIRADLFGLRDQPCPEGGPHMSFDATPLMVEFLLAHPRLEP